MEPRINGLKVAPGVFNAMMGLMNYLGQSGLGEPLIRVEKLSTRPR